MATKRSSKKSVAKASVEPVVDEAAPVADLPPQPENLVEPEPDDDHDLFGDLFLAPGYFERDGQFIRVYRVEPRGSLSCAVVFVGTDGAMPTLDLSEAAPAVGLFSSVQSAEAFCSSGWSRVARVEVPLGWRKVLARLRP